MSIGDALSRYTTYLKVMDAVRLRTNTMDEPKVSDGYLLSQITWEVQKLARLLDGATKPFYMTTVSNLTVTGTSNPYTVDMSAVTPFVERVIRAVHVGAVRTPVKLLEPLEAEAIMKLTTVHASSLFGIHEGDSIRLYKGSDFTINTSTDTVELKYYRLPKVETSSASYLDIPDSFAGMIVDSVCARVSQLKSNVLVVANANALITADINSALQAFAGGEQLKEK
jgi:hypothetical protein